MKLDTAGLDLYRKMVTIRILEGKLLELAESTG